MSRANARHWREANAKAAERCSIKRDDPPVNIAGGYKFPDAPVIELAPAPPRPLPKNGESNGINRVAPDGSLGIPEFLRRTPLNATSPIPLREAA
jgi:hypothetical protein